MSKQRPVAASPQIQTKMEVGQPDDKHEQQADAVADQVMKMPDNEEKVSMATDGEEQVQMQPSEEESVQTKLMMQADEEESVQMQPEEESVQMSEEEESVQMSADEDTVQKSEEEESVQMSAEEESVQKSEEEESVQMSSEEESVQKAADEEAVQMSSEEEKVQQKSVIQRSGDGKSFASPALASQINGSKGSGTPLSPNLNAELSSKIGSDFSKVKIHTDAKSADMNRQLGAKAFTHGNDVYFNKGNFNPGTPDGKRLLAHELTHVVQQKGKIQPQVQTKRDPIFETKFKGTIHSSSNPIYFDSTAKKNIVEISIRHRPIRCITNNTTIPSFVLQIDNATSARKTVETSGNENKYVTSIVRFTMKNAVRHKLTVLVPNGGEYDCDGPSGDPRLEFSGDLTVGSAN